MGFSAAMSSVRNIQTFLLGLPGRYKSDGNYLAEGWRGNIHLPVPGVKFVARERKIVAKRKKEKKRGEAGERGTSSLSQSSLAPNFSVLPTI